MVGIDTLGGSKGFFTFYQNVCKSYFFSDCIWGKITEPEKHYQLLRSHIERIREIPSLRFSKFVVIVERNLGFEAEHIRRAACSLEGVEFYYDSQARRTGVLTTEKVKLAAMTLLNVMLREVSKIVT